MRNKIKGNIKTHTNPPLLPPPTPLRSSRSVPIITTQHHNKLVCFEFEDAKGHTETAAKDLDLLFPKYVGYSYPVLFGDG